MIHVARRAWARGLMLVLCAATAGASLTGLLIVRANFAAADRARTHQTIAEVCKRVHRLDAAIEDLVAAGSTRKVLLQTTYYRNHPRELSLQIERAKKSARILQRADCTAAEIAGLLPPPRR